MNSAMLLPALVRIDSCQKDTPLDTKINRRNLLLGSLAATVAVSTARSEAAPTTKRRNIIFVLTDDQRYDALGFLKPQTFLQTPNMDRLAQEGAYCKNTFVTTSLCSPSRASILTGKYAFQHRVVDNNTSIPAGTVFFPHYLQQAGYKTAFFGKWHMGIGDEPQPGFDQWVSFKGQGTYLPSPNGLNVNGKHVPQKGYITDELTDYALSWLEQQPKDQPYFLYLSHKAVHSDFIPPERYKGKYDKETFVMPESAAMPKNPDEPRPMWVQNQRNSWHGIGYPYHDAAMSLGDYYKRYAETLLAVDDSLGRVFEALEKRGESNSTLVALAGDNGFCFGEHGLIDKRQAYEESIRIPFLVRCPELIKPKTVVTEDLANIDFMPTFLEVASADCPKDIAGTSFLPILQGKKIPWRQDLLYAYYWERNFPQTPTIHAIRTDRFKYVHYYGIWDSDELYDLQEDPHELRNLIYSQDHQKIIVDLKKRLFTELEAKGGMYIPLFPDSGPQMNHRNPEGNHAADFPEQMYSKPKAPAPHE